MKLYLTEISRTFNHSISCTLSSIVVDLKFQRNRDLAIRLELLKYSIRCPEAHILMAIVRIAAMMSKEPPSTRLSSMVRSYSQMAWAFSMAAILVMEPITATIAKLTICSRHLHATLRSITEADS